jgi:hypothetical protein
MKPRVYATGRFLDAKEPTFLLSVSHTTRCARGDGTREPEAVWAQTVLRLRGEMRKRGLKTLRVLGRVDNEKHHPSWLICVVQG